MRIKTAALVVLIPMLLVGLITGLTSLVAWANTGTGSGKSMTTKTAAKQYLALVAPSNAASAVFNQTTHRWTDSTTSAQMEAAAQPVIKTLGQLQQSLLKARWPRHDEGDVRALVRSIAPEIGDLETLSTVSILDASSWSMTFERDNQASGVAAEIVRADLGLPTGVATSNG